MARRGKIPDYPVVTVNGNTYFRKRIKDTDGKWASVYGKTREELYDKLQEAEKIIEQRRYRQENPTVEEYCNKWLYMQSANIRSTTLIDYTSKVRNHIIQPLGDRYMAEIQLDDLRMALIPMADKSASAYKNVVALMKNIFSSAMENDIIGEDPSLKLSFKGGVPAKRREALSDDQVEVLLDAIKGLPPYVFVMLGLYAGLRREEILGLQWDSVFLDAPTPYLVVQRAWHTEHNRPVISAQLKTAAAHREIPLPDQLLACLQEAKKNSRSDFVVANSEGKPLSYTQFSRLWKYIVTRSTKERTYYRYVNGQRIRHSVKPVLGETAAHNKNVVYSIDFTVTPHQLRHTYITNLIYAGVDPKTVQYLAGHEKSSITMDIYAKVKYNRPDQLAAVVNRAFDGAATEVASSETEENL